MNKPIYEMILENMKDGELDPAFSIPDEDGGPLRFAPGAEDGIYIYHTARRRLSSTDARDLHRIIRTASSGYYEETERCFAEYTKNHHAIAFVNEMQKYILSHAEKLNASRMYENALKMLIHSCHAECIKAALEIFEIFTSYDEPLKEIVRNLALYDEFTLNAIWVMNSWENANEEIFQTAKHVHGWGRIHCVDALKPETDEIRHWLLTEGRNNGVMESYSALTCWEKSDASNILNGNPSKEEYEAMGALLEAMLDDGPTDGIRELDAYEEILKKYAEISERYELKAEDFERLYTIAVYARNENIPGVFETVEELMTRVESMTTIRNAITNGEGFRLAAALGLPYADVLFNYLRHDFEHYWVYSGLLIQNTDYAEEVIDIFSDRLPLEEMADFKDLEHVTDEQYRNYSKLWNILTHINDRPLSGLDLLICGLKCPYEFVRMQAMHVLLSWIDLKQLPLFALSEDLYNTVRELKENTENEEEREIYASLMSGQININDQSEA